ncbi:unnamed protein product [Dicrocoelium dendriticum]|nr:unnamed protein product [Dicrocoelium dendriticum]
MSHDLQLYDARVDRRVEVRTFDILEDLGQIEYVFCDKTGTLTENKMEFKRASINGIEYTADTAHNYVNHGNSHTSEETLVPQADQTFASLRPIVAQMSLLSRDPLAASEELHLTGQGMPTSVAGDGRTESRIVHTFEEDFILAMTICNTVVVSATKNTATLFQAPTRRKGIRDIFRISPRRRSPNRKRLKRPLIDTISTKHSLSLGSLFSRRQRPLKPDSTVVPRFEIHDEDDERGEQRIAAETTTDVDPEAQSSGLATGDTVVNDTSSGDSHSVVVPELAATDASHHQTAEEVAIPVPSTLPHTQTLPPLVPGLILDLPILCVSTLSQLHQHMPDGDGYPQSITVTPATSDTLLMELMLPLTIKQKDAY